MVKYSRSLVLSAVAAFGFSMAACAGGVAGGDMQSTGGGYADASSEANSGDFEQMPLTPVLDRDGQPPKVRIMMQGKPLFFRVWQADVGRIPL